MQFLEEEFVTMEDVPDGFPAREAERCALAVDGLRASGRLRLQVHGESMLPILWPGDVVEIKSCSLDDVMPGEIVLALRARRFFLHRFVERSQNGFLLRGDSMPHPDPRFPSEALLGRLVSRSHGQDLDAKDPVRPILPLRPWAWAMGRVICFFAPARRLALMLHDRKKRNAREMQSSEFAASRAENNFGAVNIRATHIGAVDPGAF